MTVSRLYSLYQNVRARVVRPAAVIVSWLRALWEEAVDVVKFEAVRLAPVVTGVAAGVAAALAEPRTRSVTLAAVITVALGVEAGAALSLLAAALWLAVKCALLTYLLDCVLRKVPRHNFADIRRGARVAAAWFLFYVSALSFTLGHTVSPRPPS
jgi:hypothetical protein